MIFNTKVAVLITNMAISIAVLVIIGITFFLRHNFGNAPMPQLQY